MAELSNYRKIPLPGPAHRESRGGEWLRAQPGSQCGFLSQYCGPLTLGKLMDL